MARPDDATSAATRCRARLLWLKFSISASNCAAPQSRLTEGATRFVQYFGLLRRPGVCAVRSKVALHSSTVMCAARAADQTAVCWTATWR